MAVKPKIKPKIQPDAFVSKVVSDPSKPAETVLISGFVGSAAAQGYIRVYSDASLRSYVDIAESDIVHSEPFAQSSLGGYYIWVKKDAATLVGSTAGSRRARFLQGPITAQFARPGMHVGQQTTPSPNNATADGCNGSDTVLGCESVLSFRTVCFSHPSFTCAPPP